MEFVPYSDVLRELRSFLYKPHELRFRPFKYVFASVRQCSEVRVRSALAYHGLPAEQQVLNPSLRRLRLNNG
jgi:hypothetical protein